MYSVKFYPRDSRAKSESPLNLFVTYRSKRIKLSSGIKLHPELWDSKAQRITSDSRLLSKYSSQDPTFPKKLQAIKSKLSSILEFIQDYSLKVTLNRKPFDLDELRGLINAFLNPITNANTVDEIVLDYLDVFIEDATTGIRKQVNGSNYTKSTIDNYRNLRQTIQRFEASMKILLKWNMIDRQLYSRFMQWHETESFSVNYRGKHVKDLKALMRMAYEDGVHENQAFRARWFAVLSKRSERHPLNATEMKSLHDLDLKPRTTLCKARDLFLIGCYTGLRISDMRKVKPAMFIENENGRKRLRIINQKTKNEVLIPVSKQLHEILGRYDYCCPKISDQTANRLIKQIALSAGIPGLKASNLSLHLGRHSFVTHLYHSEELPMVDIMQITGHSTERNFMRYVNARPEDSARRMEQSDFFK